VTRRRWQTKKERKVTRGSIQNNVAGETEEEIKSHLETLWKHLEDKDAPLIHGVESGQLKGEK